MIDSIDIDFGFLYIDLEWECFQSVEVKVSWSRYSH
jgi:hypothetical protein